MKKGLKIIAVIAAWLLIWTIGRLFYYFNFITRIFPFLEGDEDYKYLFFCGWLILAGVIVVFFWRKKGLPFYFLNLKNKVWLFFYLIPLSQLIYWFYQNNSPFGLAGWLYGFLILITTMAQDLFTFGFLQTGLEKLTKPWLAALLVVITFYLGHFYFQASFLTLIFFVGFSGFAWLRAKYRSIYAINIIHLIFSLLPYQF
ncbi:MAG: CPBP family glutamic-type intramembrane protease [Patescibacteria group bacterium]